jgi:hypothetical protein
MNIGPVLHLGFSLLLLWGLLFFCWREYRLDALREKLFSLRNGLFLFAAQGHIAFNDPSYRMLRDLMNGMIRFAHKLNASQLLLAAIDRASQPDERWKVPMKEWRRAVDALPPDARQELISSHDEMFRAVMKHIAKGNVVLLIAFALLKLLRFIVRTFSGGATQNLTMLQAGRDLNLNLIEAQALKAQELDAAYRECELAAKGS